MQDTATENISADKPQQTSKTAIFVAIGFAVFLAIGLVVPVRLIGRVYGVFFDMLHGPLFATFAALVVFALPKRTTHQKFLVAIGVWTILAVGGILSEIIQSYIGRSASWHDMVANTLGVTAGVLWATTRGAKSRRLRVLATAGSIMLLIAGAFRVPFILTDCVIQQFDKPILASFETPLEMTRWKKHLCRIKRTSQHATQGRYSLRIEFKEADFSGIASRSLLNDWSDYKILALDITTDEGPPVELIVKVKDADHNCESSDEFMKTYQLGQGTHTIEIPLTEIAEAPRDRKLDLTRITDVQFFLINTDRPRVLHLDNLRLQ